MGKPAVDYLRKITEAQNNGQAIGLMAVCSANRFVLEAAMLHAKARNTILCIESTANQVNQFGGYTGMTPGKFAAFVLRIAEAINFKKQNIILGGDHIGPGPWQTLPAETAMAHARDLVRDCILAGYDIRKIQVLMGHRHITTTTIYLQVSQKTISKIKSPLDLFEQERAEKEVKNETSR